MADEMTQQHLRVLVARFAAGTGADTARVVGRDGDEALRTWALYDRDRIAWDPNPPAPWVRLATEVMHHGRTHYEATSPGAVLAMPIDARDRPVGALCADFCEELGDRASAVLWSARSYANAMALCVDEPDGFGQLIGTAWKDQLTGCRNAAAMWETLEDEINRAARHGGTLSCAFLDLDGFKAVNDREGHLNGDVVLAAVGTALRSAVRGYDQVARFGGDEFVLLLPGAEAAEARAMVERLLVRVAEVIGPLTAVQVTISAGVAQWRRGEDAAALLERADERLLADKGILRFAEHG